MNIYIGLIKHLFSEYGFRSIPITFNRSMTYVYYKLFKRGTFNMNGKKYPYFYNWYNVTFRNERCIELPFAFDILEKYNATPSNSILELGNVISHYKSTNHIIVDKYEPEPGVLQTDILDYKPQNKFELIISISTLEHIGWDEKPREPQKFLKVLERLHTLRHKDGKIFLTTTLGWNRALDEYILRGNFGLYKASFMKRISKDNRWKQVNRSDVIETKYNTPYPNSNAIMILEY